MVELNLRKPSVESVSPNQDSVKDAVNPLGGLQDVSVAIRQSTEVLDKLRQANVYGDANTQFTILSAETHTDFMNYTNSLDMRHTREAGEKINTYINNTLRKKYDNFLSKIPAREVRQHFKTQMEQDLRSYQNKGLDIEIGAVRLAQLENINISMNFASDTVRNDPSNETHSRQIQSIENHINSLPLDLIKKQEHFNKAKERLHTNQIIGAYQKDPKSFDGFLTASYKNVSAPKDPTSISAVIDASGGRELEVNLDVSKKIGLEGWDRLDDTKRRHLLEQLTNRDNASNTKLRTKLSAQARILDEALHRGVRPEESELIPLESYMQAYGTEKGTELYELQQLKFNSADDVARLRLMPGTEAKAFLQKVADHAADPSLSIETANKVAKYYKLLSKAHTDSMTELHQDSIKWGIKHKQIPPLRFDTPESFFNSVTSRSSYCKWLEEEHGLKSKFFSGGEEKLLKDQLMRRPAHESVEMYNQAYQPLSDGDKKSVATAYENFKDHTLSSALSLSTEFSEEAHRSAHMIIAGATNKHDVEKLYKAHPNSDNKAFDTHFKPLIAKLLSGVQGNSSGGSFEKDSEAIKLYIMGDMKATGDYKLSKKRVEDAAKMVLGNTPVSINGSPLMPPRGMDHDDFVDRLGVATKSAGEFNPYWSHYENVGGGRYALVENGNPKVDKDGNPIILNPRDVPAEKILEANKEREQASDLRRAESDITFNEWYP